MRGNPSDQWSHDRFPGSAGAGRVVVVASIREIPGRAKPFGVRYRSPDGTEHTRWFATKRQARDFRSGVESDRAQGVLLDPRLGRTTFGAWSTRWLESATHLKPRTLAGYHTLLRARILPRFGGAPLSKIEPLDVREWTASLSACGLSASSVRQSYRLFSMIMKAAVESRYIARSPCIGVRLPRLPDREMLFLDAAQVDQLASAISEPFDVLVYVLAYGGLRWGEAVALKRRRFDEVRGRLEVAESLAEVNGILHWGPTKTHARRSVVLPGFLRAMVRDHLAERVDAGLDALMFTGAKGGPMRGTNFRKGRWAPALRAAGLPDALRIHDLRHTCAALLIAENANPKLVQAHLGHSTIAVTFDRYGHLFPDDMDRIAEALDARRSRPAPEATVESLAARRRT